MINQLCFPLYAASKSVVSKYKPFLDELDLTYTQYIVMMVLWEQKVINVSELGLCLHLDSGTLTPLLKRLESKGFVRRTRSDLDERVVTIHITKAGDELKEQAANIPEQMGNCLPLNKEEIAVLYKLLYKLLD